jgi:hypothetical protein
VRNDHTCSAGYLIERTKVEIKKVGQILGLGKGAEVTGVRGKVKVIFDAKTGTNVKGDWRIESFVLADGDDEIVVDLMNRPPLDKKLKGKEIWLIAHQKAGGKGISGLKMDEYNGKVKLRVTESAEMVQDDKQAGTTGPASEEGLPPDSDYLPQKPGPAQGQPAASAAASQKAADQPKSHTQSVQNVIELAKFYGRRANALRMAADATLRLARSFAEAHGHKFDEATFVSAIAANLTQTTFTTFYINAEKSGMVDDLASGDIDKLLAAAKEQATKGAADAEAAVKAAKKAKAAELAAEAARLASEAEAE